MKIKILLLIQILFLSITLSASPIKVQLYLKSSSSLASNNFSIINFEQPYSGNNVKFWLNKRKVSADSIQINKLGSYYYIDPNATLIFTIPINVNFGELQVRFYNMNELVVKERGKIIVLNLEDLISLFTKETIDDEYISYKCKIPLKDLFYYQGYRLPYLRNKDFTSFQVEISKSSTFTGGIVLSVFDTMKNTYKKYKHLIPLLDDNEVLTFEFNKIGKQFDSLSLEFKPYANSGNLVRIEQMSITNNLLTKDIKNFNIITNPDTILLANESFPLQVYLSKKDNTSISPTIFLKITKLGIAYSRIVYYKIVALLIIFSFVLFFSNRFFAKYINYNPL